MSAPAAAKPELPERVKLPDLPREEFVLAGNAACAGCPATLAMRMVLKALGKKVIFAVPACCTAVIASTAPKTAFNIPLMNIAFEAAASCASGMRAALRHRGIDDVTVVAWAGDGGTYDIGLQALSGAFERGDDILYICYNNEMYSNTGIQRSGATPKHAWTTTSWNGKREMKKDMLAIVRAHHPPYVATASVGFPDDLYLKAKRAKEIRGPRYLEIIAPCPPGWKFETNLTTSLGRLAVETGLWPLYEEVDGVRRYTAISKQHFTGTRDFKPVDEYLRKQGRFKHLFEPQEKRDILDSMAAEVRGWWEAARKATNA